MGRHAQALDEEVDGTEERQRVDKLKADVHEAAEEHREDEGQDLVAGDRRAEHAYGDEARAQQEQADVRAHDAAAVEVAHGEAETIDREIVHRRGDQGQEHQHHTSQELGQDDLPVRQRFGKQHLYGARAVLLSKAAHGDRRDEEQEHPRRQDEQTVKVGVTVGKQVEIALKHPKKQSRDQQKHHDDHDADQGTHEIADFFLEKRVHSSINIKLAKIQIFPHSRSFFVALHII